jgi:hypothetical protein
MGANCPRSAVSGRSALWSVKSQTGASILVQCSRFYALEQLVDPVSCHRLNLDSLTAIWPLFSVLFGGTGLAQGVLDR